jgi:hypothetical protein
MVLDWKTQMLEQLTFHWEHHIRPHLDGLTDDEYFWEPVANCWSVRRRGESAAPIAVGAGEMVVEYEFPEPEPPPFTTIAWRLAHVIVGVFGARNASHFGAPPIDWRTAHYAPDAATALAQLDDGYATWVAGVAALDDERMASPVGPAEGPYATHPYSELVLHIHRETIHHMAEVLLLRDLYRFTT